MSYWGTYMVAAISLVIVLLVATHKPLPPGRRDTSSVNTRINERVRVQFRAEAFNVFNHTNFLIGENRLNKPNFGQADGTAPPRNLQFGLKLSF